MRLVRHWRSTSQMLLYKLGEKPSGLQKAGENDTNLEEESFTFHLDKSHTFAQLWLNKQVKCVCLMVC